MRHLSASLPPENPFQVKLEHPSQLGLARGVWLEFHYNLLLVCWFPILPTLLFSSLNSIHFISKFQLSIVFPLLSTSDPPTRGEIETTLDLSKCVSTLSFSGHPSI